MEFPKESNLKKQKNVVNWKRPDLWNHIDIVVSAGSYVCRGCFFTLEPFPELQIVV
jgi:hypothetical protein